MSDDLAVDAARHEAEALEAADRVAGNSRRRWMLQLTGRMMGRLLGAVFLFAGVVKALQPEIFRQEIAAYDLVTNSILVAMLAYGIVIAECTLGSALVVNLKPKISFAAATGLLLIFLGAISFAWFTGSTENCGCFGPWKRSPAEAFIEDIGLIAVAVWALWGHWKLKAPTNSVKLGVVGLGLAVGVLLPGVAGFVGEKVEPGALGVVGSTVFQKMEVEDLQVSLATGEHLVLLMSTECQHCKDAVPSANALVADARLPRLAAIAMEDKVSRGLFRQDYGAEYPIGQVPRNTIIGLLKEEFPRLFLVRNGTIVAVWDHQLPTPDTILAQMSAGQ